MRAAAIFGPNADERNLREFQLTNSEIVTLTDLSADSAFDAALIFGGDGSVHRQLAAAVSLQIPVLCVPTGSGNDFARALGLDTCAQARAAWQKFCNGNGNVRAVDVAEIRLGQPGAAAATDVSPGTGGRPEEAPGPTLPTQNSQLTNQNSLATQDPGLTTLYCCVAGAGLDSEVNRRANRLPSWLRGHGGYALSLAPALAAFRAPEISVELLDSDGPSRIQEPAMMVAFANAPTYGHGMRIAPRARLEDGKLDVCFVRRTSKLRLLRLFPMVFSGGHLSLPEVVYAQCSWLRIESERPLDIFADGEWIGRTPAEVQVRPRALRVIAP